MLSLVADKTFIIDLLGKSLPIYNLFFLIRLCDLFHNICFKGHTKGVGFSFSQLVFLFCP
jgi:hypothetical protein